VQPSAVNNLRRAGSVVKRQLTKAACSVGRRTLHTFRRGLILCYHRVCDVRHDPQLLSVSPKRFEEQLQQLVAEFEPVALSEVLNKRRGRRPLVALTFDDGYVDNYAFALPLLKKYGVPATVFVSAGFCGKDTNFYWDELFDLLMCDAVRPDHVREVFGLLLPDLSVQEGLQTRPAWNVLEVRVPSWRHAAYREVCNRLRFQTHEQRELALNRLCGLAGIARNTDSSRRVMNGEELRSCQKSGVLEIGAHTSTHASLSALTADQIRTEVCGSKATLEDILGRTVRDFSYPYGDRLEFAAPIADLVAEAGFDRVCINVPGLLLPATSAQKLPRVLVRDWDRAEFGSRVTDWLATPGPVRF